MSLPRAVLPALLLLFGAGGCASEPSVELAGKRYAVEIADSDDERAKQALYERKAAQADRVIAARRAQMEAASERLTQSLNNMRHKDDGT